MKISIAYLALLALSCAQPNIVGRAPQGPGNQILDAVRDGIKDWGPAGSLKPPEGGPKAPIKDLPGSVPNYPRPESKSESHRLNKDGGNVKGNIKKPNNSWSNKPCWKRDGRCLYRSRHMQLKTGAKSAGVIAFAALSPYARDALEKIKQWPVIGPLVVGIDDLLRIIQEAIGGKPALTIDGNQLKLKFICALRGEQKWPNDVDKECQRMREDAQKRKDLEDPEWVKAKWLEGLNQLLGSCSKLETEHPDDENLRIELEERCTELELQVHRQENPVVIVEGYPKTKIEECSCDPYNLPPEGHSCRDRCVSGYILAGTENPPPPGKDLGKENPNAKPETQPASPEATPETVAGIPMNPVEDFDRGKSTEFLPHKQADQLTRYVDAIKQLKNATFHAHTCYDNYRENGNKAITTLDSIEDCDKQYSKVQSLLRDAREVRGAPDFPSDRWIVLEELPDVLDGRTSQQGDATKELQDILQGLTKVAEKASAIQEQAERRLSDKTTPVD
ncbi:Heat-labile enterotoxin IIA, A chain, partial [Metarhizium majus ARSEF 297]